MDICIRNDEKVKCKSNRVSAHCHCILCSNRINIYIEKKKGAAKKSMRSESNLLSEFAPNSVWTGNLIKLGVDEMGAEWLLVLASFTHLCTPYEHIYGMGRSQVGYSRYWTFRNNFNRVFEVFAKLTRCFSTEKHFIAFSYRNIFKFDVTINQK